MAVMICPMASPRLLVQEESRSGGRSRGMDWAWPKGCPSFFWHRLGSIGTGTRLNSHMPAVCVQFWIWNGNGNG